MTGLAESSARIRTCFSLILTASMAIASACSSPTSPPPYDILSPATDTVSVLPNGSVRFEIRADPGITISYQVDGKAPVSGPVLLFGPTRPVHTVTAIVRSTSPATTLLEKSFVVITEVPGNLPPEVLSLTVENGLEALRDTVHAQVVVGDPDGSVQEIEIDFGDGTPPELSVGQETQLEAEHVYGAAGLYWVTVTVTDSVEITGADSTLIQLLPPNQLPVGSLTVSGATSGNAPLAVTLIPQGSDADGTIVKWELDPEGDGSFQTIQPLQPVTLDLEFLEAPYRPVLRLTDDDGDHIDIPAAAEILVYREIDASASSASATGNPTLSALGNPIIWADGEDRLSISAQVRDPLGGGLRQVPLRITATRPSLVAANGTTQLGSTIEINPDTPETGSDGRATAILTTRASTRIEAAPQVGSIPFEVRVEASRGHGEWVEIGTIGGVEASSTVDRRAGRTFVVKQGGGGYCAGDTVEIGVEAITRSGTPAAGKYVEIRLGQFSNQVWFGAVPAAGYGNWRTDSSGRIVFNYVPTQADRNQIIVAWVDGNPLEDSASFNLKQGC